MGVSGSGFGACRFVPGLALQPEHCNAQEDVEKCLAATGADALMSAVGLLLDHRMFSSHEPRTRVRNFEIERPFGAGAGCCYDVLDLAHEYCEAAIAHVANS